MEITFRTGKLEKQYASYDEAVKAYGREVGRKYVQRINIIAEVKDIDELFRQRPLRCHRLKGKRRNEYAVKLTDHYRLIFTLQGNKLQIVCIEEVSKHYD